MTESYSPAEQEALDIAIDCAKDMYPALKKMVQTQFAGMDIEVEDLTHNAYIDDAYGKNAEACIGITPYGFGEGSPKFKKLKDAVERVADQFEGGECDIYVGTDQSYVSVPLNHIIVSAICIVFED